MAQPAVIEGFAMFTYRSLTAADAQEWREIFVTGVKNFPTGFLMTPAEVDDPVSYTHLTLPTKA